MTSAADFVPDRTTLPALRKAAAGCRGCDLYRDATQTVFGEGPPDARIVMVGEQPGDREDLAGRPFVGPAGGVLDRAIEEAGLIRDEIYFTNVVKHFKHVLRGKRRIHRKPDMEEIRACAPWLEAELTRIGPQVLVLLGATAAQALLGRSFRVTQQRGHLRGVAARPARDRHGASILDPPIPDGPGAADRDRGLHPGPPRRAAGVAATGRLSPIMSAACEPNTASGRPS